MGAPAVRTGERGSALVAVLLVILVLTVVGLGVAYFAQMEDSLTGNERLIRSAFYTAEAGLRKGETVIDYLVSQKLSLTTILTCGTCTTASLNPPGGGWPAVILNATDPEDGLTREFANRAVALPGYVVDRGSYSIYVRNNADDPAGQSNDSDNIVLLVSVGQVQGAAGRIYTKILEEQVATGTFGTEAGGQYGATSGSTQSGVKGE